MTNITDAMKALLYFFAFLLITLSQVFADCNESLLDFEMKTEGKLSKSMMAYDDVKDYSNALSELKSTIKGQACAAQTLSDLSGSIDIIKEKRIATIQKFLKLGITEESGNDLRLEYDYLTGKSKKYKYEFEDIFVPSAVKTYDTIVVPAKKEIVKAPEKIESTVQVQKPAGGGKCDDRIIESASVNLNNVRNQDTVGWCYAYVAADLLSFKLGKKISAVSLYNTRYDQSIEDNIRVKNEGDGGNISLSIEKYLEKKKGLCLEEDLPSNDFKFCTDMNYFNFLNGIISAAKENRLESELNNNQCFNDNLQAAFPGINKTLLRSYAYSSGSKKLIEYLYSLQCNKVSFPNIQIKTVIKDANRGDSVESMLKQINERLKSNQLSEIGYDFNKLSAEEGAGNHSSIVIGKRTNPETGSCDYLIRNSWGKECSLDRKPGVSCHKNCVGDSCRFTGNFWMSEEKMKESLFGTTYIE